MNPILNLALSGLFVLPLAQSSGRLDLEHVPADAAWLVHVDIEATLHSSLGRFLLEHGEELQLHLAERLHLQRQLGLDPLKDLRGATLFAYGPSGETVGGTVVTLDTNHRADELVDRLRGEHPGYSSHEVHGQRIHTCSEASHTVHGFLRPGASDAERTLVYSEDRNALLATLLLFEGERPGAARAERPSLLLKPGDGSLIYLAARTEMLPALRRGPASIFFRQTERWACEIAEAEGALRLRAAITGRTDASAGSLVEVVEGVVALARMFEEEQGLHAALRRLALASRVTRHGREIIIETRGGTEELIGCLHTILAAHAGLPGGLHSPVQRGDDGHR